MIDTFPYSRTIDNGFERCVYCGIVFGAEDRANDDQRGEQTPPGIGGGVNYTYGPVTDRHGREYDMVAESDPVAYLLHPECYRDWRAERAAEEHRTLEAFAEPEE